MLSSFFQNFWLPAGTRRSQAQGAGCSSPSCPARRRGAAQRRRVLRHYLSRSRERAFTAGKPSCPFALILSLFTLSHALLAAGRHTALSSSMSQIFASCVSSAPGTRREAARTSSRALTSCNRAFNAGEPRSTFPFQCPFSRSDLPFFQRAWPPAGKPRLSRAMGRPSSRASRAALCAAQTLTPYLLFRRAGSFKLQVTYSSVLPFIVHYYR
ncbi:hypothetical protein C8R47DRAFT_614944 [Mycena vitilis]|nr:hypothetical protein C8R47DRAFT_614944 [Mycena vitilis]